MYIALLPRWVRELYCKSMYAPFRIEYRRAGTLAIVSLLCRSLAHAFSCPIPWKKCSILLTEMTSKSPDFIKWWPKCMNLNVAKASQTQRMCEAISDVCFHTWHYQPHVNGCPFKRQCYVSSPAIILSWFLLRVAICQLFCRGSLKKYLSLPLFTVFHSSSPWSPHWQPLQICSIKLTFPSNISNKGEQMLINE